ncbi:VOC family protein [Methylobacterium sp. A54F]
MVDRPDMPLAEGMRHLSPHLVCAGAAEAIAFYEAAFDAVELNRLAGPDGKLWYAAVVINGASVLLVDENPAYNIRSPKALGGSPVTLHLFVRDADAVVAQAVAAGARVTMPVQDMFWGDRYGVIEDPFGHRWSIATPLRPPMSNSELQAAAAAMFPPA